MPVKSPSVVTDLLVLTSRCRRGSGRGSRRRRVYEPPSSSAKRADRPGPRTPSPSKISRRGHRQCRTRSPSSSEPVKPPSVSLIFWCDADGAIRIEEEDPHRARGGVGAVIIPICANGKIDRRHRRRDHRVRSLDVPNQSYLCRASPSKPALSCLADLLVGEHPAGLGAGARAAKKRADDGQTEQVCSFRWIGFVCMPDLLLAHWCVVNRPIRDPEVRTRSGGNEAPSCSQSRHPGLRGPEKLNSLSIDAGRRVTNMAVTRGRCKRVRDTRRHADARGGQRR